MVSVLEPRLVVIHVDTHVVVWLAGGEGERLSRAGRAALADSDVRISPMVLLELGYLHEMGRITKPADVIVSRLGSSLGATLSDAPFPAIIAHALDVTWTRDPFDRVMVATALADGARLVTSDRVIRANSPVALWD